MIRIESGNEISRLMSEKRWVYWLQEAKRDPDNDDRFLVCLVFENERGYFPMLGQGVGAEPWYWDKETCAIKNAEHGYDEEETFKIVASSMFCPA